MTTLQVDEESSKTCQSNVAFEKAKLLYQWSILEKHPHIIQQSCPPLLSPDDSIEDYTSAAIEYALKAKNEGCSKSYTLLGLLYESNSSLPQPVIYFLFYFFHFFLTFFFCKGNEKKESIGIL